MITQNRCRTVKYIEDSLASIRPSPVRYQPPHALSANRHQTGLVLVTVRRRHSKEGKDNSPAEEHGPPFAVSLHGTRALYTQMYWTIDTKCNCTQSIGGQPKKYRRYRTKDMKIRERRSASRCVLSSSSMNVVVAAARRESS